MRAGQEALPPSLLEMAVVIPLLAEFDRRLLMWVRHSDPVAQIITLTLNDHAGVRLEKVQPDDPSFAVDIQPVPQRSGVTR
ncbi:MAG: hypothetical protein LR015_13600 [Verrucomicrobia bacterium]|nr:hypothetical protein [Verrucomicrobiota bacterium]